MKILVTGCCGFIGTHLCIDLLKQHYNVIGIDNFFPNYDIEQKKENLRDLIKFKNFTFIENDILDLKFSFEEYSQVIHLASIPGVRESLVNPLLYIRNNIEKFVYLLEECKKNNINKIVYASSSSVYGNNTKVPFNEEDQINKLRSSYACSKKCMEVYSQYYNDVFDMNIIGIRFFTVYGERGRPDMAPFIFLKNISNNTEILQYGNGESYRDYTYVGDIVDGIMSIIKGKGMKGEIYNLGSNNPITLKKFIKICESITGKKANKRILEEQLGDVQRTYADISKAQKDLNYEPKQTLENGLLKMFNWMKQTYKV